MLTHKHLNAETRMKVTDFKDNNGLNHLLLSVHVFFFMNSVKCSLSDRLLVTKYVNQFSCVDRTCQWTTGI